MYNLILLTKESVYSNVIIVSKTKFHVINHILVFSYTNIKMLNRGLLRTSNF